MNQSFLHDYGKYKLEHFKNQARQILGVATQHGIDASYIDHTGGAQVDIVSAYKELKKAVMKSS